MSHHNLTTTVFEPPQKVRKTVSPAGIPNIWTGIERERKTNERIFRSGSTIVKFPNLSPKEYEIIREGCALESTEKKLDALGYRRKLELWRNNC